MLFGPERHVHGVHLSTPSLGGAAHTGGFLYERPPKKSGLEKKMPGMFVKLMSISRAREKKAW